MRPDRRVLSLICVGLATLLAAVLLSRTAWRPEQEDAGGNIDAATEPPFDARIAVPPTAFYTPPSPLPEQPPGTLLRSEQISGLPEGVAAWRLLYLSSDHSGSPVAISGVYFEPTTLPETGDRFPLVAFAHGTTGIGRGCGLSQAPFTDGTAGNEYWRTLIQPMVGAGYAVVATDYEGMGAPGKRTYLLRKQSYDVLDSLRAALTFRPQRLDSLNLAVVGHSEGGYVALTTADMAADYAPELAIRGSVSMAPGAVPPVPFAIKTLLSSTGGDGPTPRSGYIADLSGSWNDVYPQLSSPDVWYTDIGKQEVPRAQELCQGAQLDALNRPFHDYYVTSVPADMARIPAAEQPLTQYTSIPILIQQGRLDAGVVPQVSLALAIQGCALGDSVEYEQYPGDVHRSVQYTGRTSFLDWLNARFDGTAPTGTCRGW